MTGTVSGRSSGRSESTFEVPAAASGEISGSGGSGCTGRSSTAFALQTLAEKGLEYLAIRAEHIWKENDVLYPMGRRVLSEADGRNLVAAFRRIASEAYGEKADAKFAAMLREVEGGSRVRKSLLHNLSMEQIDAIMETLPVEVTFVDEKDTVAYFNRLDNPLMRLTDMFLALPLAFIAGHVANQFLPRLAASLWDRRAPILAWAATGASRCAATRTWKSSRGVIPASSAVDSS